MTKKFLLQVIVETEDVYGEKYQYDCGDYKLESQGQDCVPGVNCSQTKVQYSRNVYLGSTLAKGTAGLCTLSQL
jgi:hypothetical protein